MGEECARAAPRSAGRRADAAGGCCPDWPAGARQLRGNAGKAESARRNDRMRAAAAELRALAKNAEASGGRVRLDPSLAGEMEYCYNGLVFQGYLQGLPRPRSWAAATTC